MNTVFVLDEGAVDTVINVVAKDYPILKTLSGGEREEAYQVTRMRLETAWRSEAYDVLEMFAVELEDREHRPSRGGR